MKEITAKEALSKMASYCSSTERCKTDIYEKLRKLNVDNETIEQVIKALEEDNFLNEERYCQSFINDKVNISKWGKIKINQALRMKRIPENIIRKYLDKIDEEQYSGILKALLENKKRTINAKDEYDMKAKLIRFAYSRGFSMEDINKYVSLD